MPALAGPLAASASRPAALRATTALDPLESLQSLVPAYMDELPLDPFTGKPLEYSVDVGKIRLRSAGEDSAS